MIFQSSEEQRKRVEKNEKGEKEPIPFTDSLLGTNHPLGLHAWIHPPPPRGSPVLRGRIAPGRGF